uniref:Uncharacterized protein n=1 Tax=Octopus bimaculoides TaxID=37653 RepID=A0A0L8HLE7_OCTBM
MRHCIRIYTLTRILLLLLLLFLFLTKFNNFIYTDTSLNLQGNIKQGSVTLKLFSRFAKVENINM